MLQKLIANFVLYFFVIIKLMEFLRDISLKSLNTFGIEAKARFFLNLKHESDLNKITDKISNSNIFCLGGGSNVLFVNDFDGLVISNNLRGIKIIDSDDKNVTLEVAAGENWHNFVALTLKNKYYGLENLALIPGKVGGAPIQNIGAYGSEQSEFFIYLKAFNLKDFEFKTFSKEECLFDYRTSVFKNRFKNRYLITNVAYKLSRRPKINLKYKELEEEIIKIPSINPDPEYIFESVCRIRRRKLPDPLMLGNAGSFFKNPIIDKAKFDEIKNQYVDFPGFAMPDGKMKVFAAWLIEKCGWKGYREGDAGVHENHSLILVNYGNSSGKDILDLSNKIKDSVFEKFDILLEPEVEIVK